MYLEHFKLKELPFTLTPNPNFFCTQAGHQSALNIVLLSLRNGEGFIKVVGEVGAGKTLICRMLLESLDDKFVTAYIPNPDLSPIGLRRALFHELSIPGPLPNSHHEMLESINNHLMTLNEMGKRVVLLIDEAQAMSSECLEALRLLTNLETKTTKLLQVVLLGQPELDIRLNQNNLRQLKQRITFSYYLSPLDAEQVDAYLCHRLATAGHTTGSLFTRRARKLLFLKSGGIPRVINILCHKAMMAAFGRGAKKVDHRAVRNAVRDTEYVTDKQIPHNLPIIMLGMLLIFSMLAGLKFYYLLSNHIRL